MEQKATLLESLMHNIEQYIQTNIEIVKLQSIEKLSGFISHLLAKIIVFIVILIFFIMVNIGIAIWIGEALNCSFAGFFIVAFFYLIVALILHFGSKSLVKGPILNSIVKNLNQD